MLPRNKSFLGVFLANFVPFVSLVVGLCIYWWFWSYVLYRPYDPFTLDGGLDLENPKLLNYIDEKFLKKLEAKWRFSKLKPVKIANQLIPPRIYNLLDKSFENRNVGFYVEYAPKNSSITGFLEGHRQWYGLIIEPNPMAYKEIETSGARSAWLAPVCLSKSKPEMKYDPIFDITIECFPLFPLLAALEETTVDLLVFNASDAWDLIEFIPFRLLRIRMILIRGIPSYKKSEFDGMMKKSKYFKKGEDQEDYSLYLNHHDYNLYSDSD